MEVREENGNANLINSKLGVMIGSSISSSLNDWVDNFNLFTSHLWNEEKYSEWMIISKCPFISDVQ